MAQALYRTYRPTDFSELVNQDSIKQTLQNELKHNRVAHAYLFSGPRGVGKTTTARLLAKAVNTQELPEEQRDKTAQEILAGKSIDVIEIDAASHTGVDNVRENIIENARFTPQYLQYKVFIIDEVHMLSTSAFNALLKTLEEPPEHVIFILATTEIHRVPETIISRCQRFDFKRVSIEDLVTRMEYIIGQEKVTVDQEILRTIARRADGSVRDAEVLLGQILALGGSTITADQAALVLPRSNIQSVTNLFIMLMQRETAAGIELVSQLVTDGVQLQDFTRELIEFLRVVLLYRAHGLPDEFEQLGLDPDLRQTCEQLMQSRSPRDIVSMIETFLEAERELRFAPIPQLPLEIAIVTLTTDTDKPSEPPAPAPPAAPAVRTTSKSGQQPAPRPTKSPKPKPTAAAAPKAKPTVAKATTKKSSISLEKIKKHWPEILNIITKQHRSLGMSLKVAVPYAIEDGRLIIAFQHAFHAERVSQPNTRATIQDIITEHVGGSLGIGTTVLDPGAFDALQPAEAKPAASGPSVVQQAVEVFGGEVLEDS